jgi:hypothetical protein
VFGVSIPQCLCPSLIRLLWHLRCWLINSHLQRPSDLYLAVNGMLVFILLYIISVGCIGSYGFSGCCCATQACDEATVQPASKVLWA